MINPSAQAAYVRGRDKRGVAVTFQRVNGHAPRTRLVQATIVAVVQDYLPDTAVVSETGGSTRAQGTITQGDRRVTVIAQDLLDKRFPLPLKKNDKIIVVDTGENLNIVSADASKKAMAGVIDVVAAGV